ncbi:hypothetical protein [Desulfosporosinus meridiei]|uniref:Uncharacterized protein n=1 Tax=Desulfosporosinus meridiei (strain ATCC BAA-275 / DSM 13257 / KCTC 12902 / NCIMB 13706 / S10) TaxID=768704 RepID=J7J4A1_DESMD|nr:hypothetical protein [Desulfosporosinus meridiei]AFQ46103.1 hypothetical protein Desmer_4283 [Desulfosporosinus meridiei DSM 13257]
MSWPFKSRLSPRSSPPPTRACSNPPLSSTVLKSWDYGFKRLVPLLEYPTLGTGLLACTVFLFIAFFSDVILANITYMSLGIVVTISTFVLLLFLIFIQILL